MSEKTSDEPTETPVTRHRRLAAARVAKMRAERKLAGLMEFSVLIPAARADELREIAAGWVRDHTAPP
jgi:hypothetical protein